MKNIVKNIVRQIRTLYLRFRIKRSPLLELNFHHPLIIAPHPDDEVLGCGGLIAKLVHKGIFPHIIMMTEGERSHDSCCTLLQENIAQTRHQLTLRAAKILGLPKNHIHCLHYPDGGITPSNKKETNKLRLLLQNLKCDTIFVPHWGEGWNDHIMVAQIIKELAITNVQIYEYCVWLWYYNIWNLSWEKARQLQMNNHEFSLKQKAMHQYVTPLAPCGNPWSGILPELLIKANLWDKELYFKMDKNLESWQYHES